jgi:hypothetical protein
MMKTTIKRSDYVPHGNVGCITSEGISATLTFGRDDQFGFSEGLKDFVEIVFWHFFGMSQFMDGKFSAMSGEGGYCSEAVIGFF